VLGVGWVCGCWRVGQKRYAIRVDSYNITNVCHEFGIDQFILWIIILLFINVILGNKKLVTERDHISSMYHNSYMDISSNNQDTRQNVPHKHRGSKVHRWINSVFILLLISISIYEFHTIIKLERQYDIEIYGLEGDMICHICVFN
jgi:hypothetical protein